MSTHIRSAILVRAPTAEEVRDNAEIVVEASRQQIALYGKQGTRELFDADFVFSTSVRQEEVYERTMYPIVGDLFHGISSAFVYVNAMHYLYGTYEEPGAFSRLVSDIFDEVGEKRMNATVEFAAYQLHSQAAQTKITDLGIANEQHAKVKSISAVSFKQVDSADALFDAFDAAASRAQDGWHSGVAIRVTTFDPNFPEVLRVGEVRLIDLKKTGVAIQTELTQSAILKGIVCDKTPYLTTLFAVLAPTAANFYESNDILTGTRILRKFAVDAHETTTLTQYGKDVQNLNDMRARLQQSHAGGRLAEGAPATEDEEKLAELEAIFQKTYLNSGSPKKRNSIGATASGNNTSRDGVAHQDANQTSEYGAMDMEDEDGFEGMDGADDPDGYISARSMPLPTRDMPLRGPLWHKRDLLAQKYGAHASIFIPTVRRGTDGAPSEATKTVYKGEWLNNKKHGRGTEIVGDYKYEGQFRNGKRHGLGVLYMRHGSGNNAWIRVYKGNFVEGKKERHGTAYYANGEIYEGEFHGGLREGRGTYFYTDGDKYEGQWYEGKRHGFGTLVKPNGDYYEGQWKNGDKNGPGVFVYLTAGQRYDGEWRDGIPVTGHIQHINGAAGTAAQIPPQHVVGPDEIVAREIAKLRAQASEALK
jgi:hypothetical protein